MKVSLFILLFSFSALSAKCQYLKWMVSAQASTTSNSTSNYQGGLLAGFKTLNDQQVSFGPIVKSFLTNNHVENMIGARMYSQTPLATNIGLYIQCDFLEGVKPDPLLSVYSNRSVRLEPSMGFTYTFINNIGISAGYNFGDYNPISYSKTSAVNVKLIYDLPFRRF